MKTFTRAVTLAAALIAANVASAGDKPSEIRVGDLIIDRPWTREAPPSAPAMGGYLTIRNEGEVADTLMGGSTSFASLVEVHEMAVTDGIMTMRALDDGLEIAPGETVTLEPGGLHLMFMRLDNPPKRGETVAVTLNFANAGEVTLDMAVGAVGAKSPDGEVMTDGNAMTHGPKGHDETMKMDGAMSKLPADAEVTQ